jgi:uncharacterized membrane protein YqhA
MQPIFALARYFILVPVLATLVGAVTLSLFETAVLFKELVGRVRESALTLKEVKLMAVGLIEAIDVFLISIAAYVMSISL